MRYVYLEHTSAYLLAQEVNKHLSEGWKLHGNSIYAPESGHTSEVYAQPMIYEGTPPPAPVLEAPTAPALSVVEAVAFVRLEKWRGTPAVAALADNLSGLFHGTESDHIPGFTGIEEELADTVIRIMDLDSLRVGQAIIAKLAFNRTRGYKHGGKAC